MLTGWHKYLQGWDTIRPQQLAIPPIFCHRSLDGMGSSSSSLVSSTDWDFLMSKMISFSRSSGCPT